MDKAKENYKIGEVRIVDAVQIKKEYNRSISYEEKKFFCSNCGEYVTYVNREKGKTFFRHAKKTEESNECELRIDSQSELTVYQKVGLPIYLKKDINNYYSIYIGFYAIDKNKIEILKNEKVNIVISGVKSRFDFRKMFYIDDINFNSDITTLKQINFLSPKYKILYSNPKSKQLLSDKWGSEVEGISSNGAIFKIGENGGRKIRINEEIIENTEYLCIFKDDRNFRLFSGISYKEIGKIEFSNGTYRVYKIKFSLQGWDKKKLIEFCREIFKISLVSKPSEIIPIWPPTINDDNKIELVFNKNNLLLLKSSHPNAKAYLHRMKNYREINLNKVDNDKYTFMVAPISMESAININDEYNSEYLFVSNYKNKIKTFENKIIIKDIEDNNIERGRYSKLPKDKKIKIYSNSEIEIIHYRKGILFKLYRVNNEESMISDLKYEDKLVVKIGLKKHTLIEFEKIKEVSINSSLNDIEIYKDLINLKGSYEPIDSYMKNLLIHLKDYPKTFNLIKYYISRNRAPIGTSKVLKNIKVK